MEHVSAVVPSVATAQFTTPSADLPPPADANVPPPTAEQAAISDRVFTEQPHPAATLLGVLTSALLLRDVAVDTFDTSGEEDELEEKDETGNDGNLPK